MRCNAALIPAALVLGALAAPARANDPAATPSPTSASTAAPHEVVRWKITY